jgi:hypothetical protein
VRNDGAAREPGFTQMETRECWGGGADIRTVLGISLRGLRVRNGKERKVQRARSHADGNQRMLEWRS